MPRIRLPRALAVASVAILSTALAGPAAAAAPRADTVAPTAPRILYAQGFQCLTVVVGAMRSTDDVTPAPALRYDVFADGVRIGSLTDRGASSGVWGVLQLVKPGPATVTAQAVDAAGNRSPRSNADVVTGYHTPGCTPGLFG